MKNYVILVLVFIVACSNPTSMSFPEKKKDYNTGREYEWHNKFSENVVFNNQQAEDNTGWMLLKEFCFGAEFGMADFMGRGIEAEGIYPSEFLPVFFKRKLVLTEFNPADGELAWLFTGEKGGMTVFADSLKISLSQRFYNSNVLNEKRNGKMYMSRHAEKEVVRSDVHYTGNIESIMIEMTSNHQFCLYVNNEKVAEQLCFQDLTQHQFRYTGTEGNICGEIYIPSASKASVTVNPDNSYQELLGFGGITSIPSYYQLSDEGREMWWKLLEEYNLFIQREYPNGSKLNKECTNFDSINLAKAHYYGENFPNGEISDFAYNKKIFDIGGMVIFEFWSLPGWTIKPGTKTIPIFDKYTEAMVNYCKQSVTKTGKAPQILGIQNEQEQPDSVWQQMTLHLREALDKNGFNDVKIHMHNSSRFYKGINAAKAFAAIPEVWKAIDYSASNIYDYQDYIMHVDAFDTLIAKWNVITKGKPFISIELCQNFNFLQEQSYKTAFFMGQLYHKNMVMMDASAIVYCWLLCATVQPSYQASRSLFAIDMSNNFVPVPSSYQLRVFGSYSKHILKGMKRIDALSNDNDILVSAYQDKLHQTLIITNRGMVDKKIELEWPGVIFMKAEITNQYNPNKLISLTKEIIVKPGDILTLYK